MPVKARTSGNYASPCIVIKCRFILYRQRHLALNIGVILKCGLGAIGEHYVQTSSSCTIFELFDVGLTMAVSCIVFEIKGDFGR